MGGKSPFQCIVWHDQTLHGDGQAGVLDQTYFHEELSGGFYIEAGAYDGHSGKNIFKPKC